MATGACKGKDERRFTGALSGAVSRVRLPGIAIKQVNCYSFPLRSEGRILWLLTSFGKSVYYEVLPFLFDFAEVSLAAYCLPLYP